MKRAADLRPNSPINQRMLWFAIATQSMWFFGNLYEEVVIVPNGLFASSASIAAYNAYFSVTNAAFYYVPTSQLGYVSLLWLAFQSRRSSSADARLLRRAAAAATLAVGLSVLIIVHWNFRLWLADVSLLTNAQTHALVREWALANLVRLILVGFATVTSVRAQQRTVRNA